MRYNMIINDFTRLYVNVYVKIQIYILCSL